MSTTTTPTNSQWLKTTLIKNLNTKLAEFKGRHYFYLTKDQRSKHNREMKIFYDGVISGFEYALEEINKLDQTKE